MAIRIVERFDVDAPPVRVWEHLVDPRRVVSCVPGGELEEIVDARTFHGTVRVRIAGVTLAFRGRVRLEEVDEGARHVRIVGVAREGGKAGSVRGSVRLVLESEIAERPDGGAAVEARASAEVAGRIVNLWQGPLEVLAHELFRDFSGCVRGDVEADERRRRGSAAGRPLPPAATPRGPRPPLRLVPLLLRALGAWARGLVGGEGRSRARPRARAFRSGGP